MHLLIEREVDDIIPQICCFVNDCRALGGVWCVRAKRRGWYNMPLEPLTNKKKIMLKEE